MKDCRWFTHDWSKWEQYKQNFTLVYNFGKNAGKEYQTTEDWQKRKCNKCGKEQREEVGGHR